MAWTRCPSCGTTAPPIAGRCLKCRTPLSAVPPGSYPVEPFVFWRGGPRAGALAAFGTGLAGATALGAFAAQIRPEPSELGLMFAVCLGAGIGATAGAGAWLARCRQPYFVFLAGALAGLAGAVVQHYAGYRLALRADPLLRIDFGEYIDRLLRARVLGGAPPAAALYYLTEVVATVLLAGAFALSLLRRPFCEQCGRWKRREKLETCELNGAVAARAIAAGRPAEMVAPAEGKECVTLELFRCRRCGNRGRIDVRATCLRNDGGDVTEVEVFVTYPGDAAGDFDAVRRRVKAPGREDPRERKGTTGSPTR